MKMAITILRDPKAVCLYLAKTAGNAREYIWPELKDIVHRYSLPFVFNETSLRMQHKRASGKALFRGADTQKDIEKHRGMKFAVVILDESGTFGAELESLILSVIGPSLRDCNGELLLLGTPGPFPEGLFYEVSEGQKRGWINHRWSLRDNPHLSSDAKNLDMILDEEGLTREDPIFIREYLGEYAINLRTQMFTFDRLRNTLPKSQFPDPSALTWFLGVDFGWVDATAIVPVGFNMHSRTVYAPEGWKASEQTSDDVATQLLRFKELYPIKKVIGDVGGYGKGVAEQIQRDYGIHIHAAQKRDKLNYIEFINSAFLRGDVKVEAGSQLAEELPTILWNEKKTDAHGRAKDNLAMALLYAWRAVHFLTRRARSLEPVGPADPRNVDTYKLEAIKQDDALRKKGAKAITKHRIESWYTRV